MTDTVTLLLVPGSSMMTLASILDPLRAANRLSRQQVFDWTLTSLDGQPVGLTCGISIPVDAKFCQTDHGSLLIVIAGFNHESHLTAQSLQSLRAVAPRFKTIMAVEAGTWILARAQLITHHSVTTHWEDLDNFSETFPEIDLRRQRYVIDGKFWSCGGASPALDMMLRYIRQNRNPSLALDIASVFIYNEAHGPSAEQMPISLGRTETLEPRLAKAVRIMENNIEEPLPIPAIAEKINLSPRMFELLSRKYLADTPAAFYSRLRLQTARRLVLDTSLSIQEITVRSGFNSASVFSRAFKHRYGQSPLQLRRRAFGMGV